MSCLCLRTLLIVFSFMYKDFLVRKLCQKWNQERERGKRKNRQTEFAIKAIVTKPIGEGIEQKEKQNKKEKQRKKKRNRESEQIRERWRKKYGRFVNRNRILKQWNSAIRNLIQLEWNLGRKIFQTDC